MSARERPREETEGGAERRNSVGPMLASDIGQVMTIERASFSDPWPEFAFLQAMNSSSCYARAARAGELVIGYLIGHINGPELHIANVAVRPEARGRGIGRRLMMDVLTTRALRCSYAVLDVRESNEVAIRLYRQLGFEQIGRRPGYYRYPTEDALVMRRSLPAADMDW
jgi:ribosomal-protein-alanine N-acetyltransferase